MSRQREGAAGHVIVVRCAFDGSDCNASIQGSKWSTIMSQNRGWFFQRNGLAWCPSHTPSWVEDWRKRRSTRRLDDDERRRARDALYAQAALLVDLYKQLEDPGMIRGDLRDDLQAIIDELFKLKAL